MRNRDYWTINAITPDGDLTVTRIDGHGTVTLPNPYVAEHVQLGYAATEPGNQSDTAARSLTLATPATTCRRLYVAVTRGRDENLICVVTDTHDITDAIDTLEQILASDRADQPATRVRRELAAATPPAPTPQPRCSIPNWFHDLRHETRRELADARAAVEAQQREDASIEQRIEYIDQQLADLAPRCAPHDHAIAHVTRDLEAARGDHRQAERDLASSSRVHRRSARHAVSDTADDIATAQVALDELTNRAQPLLNQRDQLHDERDRLRNHAGRERQVLRTLSGSNRRLAAAQHTMYALEIWQAWADGHDVRPNSLIAAARQLHQHGDNHAVLARPLVGWLQQHRVVEPPRTSERAAPMIPMQPRIEPPSLGIGL